MIRWYDFGGSSVGARFAERDQLLKKRGYRMLRLLLRWFLQALGLLLVAYFVPGFTVRNFPAALIAVLVIGLLNATLGLLLKLITLPLGILTLGLFFLVINAIMLEVASAIVPGFHVASFGAAFIGAVVLAVLHMIVEAIAD
jgi:putative membrane protein